MNDHRCEFRVYYEDTDAGGIVYYANYLKFAERARTEMLRALGINQIELIEKENLGFVVRRATMELMKPARLDDLLEVVTTISRLAGASVTIDQSIQKDGQPLVTVSTLIVSVSMTEMKPKPISPMIREKFSTLTR